MVRNSGRADLDEEATENNHHAVTPAPALAGRDSGGSPKTIKINGFPLQFIPHLMRDGNDIR
jgi:hypothetical protein